MRVMDANQIKRAAWTEYVAQNTQGTVFHTPFMYDVYLNTPGHEPFAYFVTDTQNEIQAMLSGFIQTVKPGILSGLSKRAVLMQSPISNDPEALKLLLEYYLKEMKKRVLYTEIRNHVETKNVEFLYLEHGFKFEDHLNILIDLSQSEDHLWKQIHSKRRNEIRKAVKEGVSVRTLDLVSMPEVYGILQEVYHRARLPLLSYTFFYQAIQKSAENSAMRIYGAYWQDRLIGTMVTLQYRDTVYDLFAGSLSAHYDKNPNDIIPWEVFISCKENGFTRFDFGGAGKPSVPYGVRDYKLKFGGQLINYGRYILIHAPVRYQLAEKGFRLMQQLKRRK